MEVVGGVLWVWMPIFGINEKPSFTVILGGTIITLAVLFHGYGAKKKKRACFTLIIYFKLEEFFLGKLSFVHTLSRHETIFSICSLRCFGVTVILSLSNPFRNCWIENRLSINSMIIN